MKRIGLFLLGAFVWGGAGAVELPEVTEAAIAELGTTQGTPQMNGFVFIEGRYIPPPYTVTRKGNGIFINRIQIEQQPIPWLRSGAEDDAAPVATPAKKSVDADGDFEEVKGVAKPAPAPAAEAAPAADPAKPKTVKSIDDLFDDDTPAKPAPAVKPVPAPAAAPAAAAVAPAEQPSAAATAAVAELTSDDLKRQKEALVANLERLRKGYDQALIQNEFFFFSLRSDRVNGNYGTARTLMGVLPKALRYAQSPQGLMQRLNEGGVYFIDLSICKALFKNKSTFPLLEDRLAKIEEDEELDALKRKPEPLR
jgi:hypothetical protein